MDDFVSESEPALTVGDVQNSREAADEPKSIRYKNVLSAEFLERLANAANEPWELKAACRGKQEIMFEHLGEKLLKRRKREAAAKQICRECRVVANCLEKAIQNDEKGAVWGGLTDAERSEIKPLKGAS